MGKTVPRTVLDAAKSARPSGRNMAQIHLARMSVQKAGLALPQRLTAASRIIRDSFSGFRTV